MDFDYNFSIINIGAFTQECVICLHIPDLKNLCGFILDEENMQEKIKIEGMTCNGCVANVKRVLEKTEGVQSAIVDIAGFAVVDYDDKKTTRKNLEQAIDTAGFTVVN